MKCGLPKVESSKFTVIKIKTERNIKRTIYVLTCFFAIFIGGVQYSFAHNTKEKKKEEMDSSSLHKIAMKGKTLSAKEAKNLEKKVAENPDDLHATIKLLGYYLIRQFKDDGIRQKRKKLILKLIENHPENKVCGSLYGRLYKDCEAIVKLWKAQVKKHPRNLKILWNASRNLFLMDKKLVEQYLKKGKALEPENLRWSTQLGFLYYLQSIYSNSENALKSYEEYKKVYGQTQVNKLYTILPNLGRSAYIAGKYKEADTYAKEMIWRGENTVNAQDKTIFIYNGTYLCGLLALKSEKTEKACNYLIESGKVLNLYKPSSYSPDMTLAYLLFLKNKHACVTEYLKLCLKRRDRKEYKEWIADVKIGLMPNFRSITYIMNYSNARAIIVSQRCSKLLSLGKKLSAEQASVLERVVESTPEKKTYKIKDDISKLLGYYSQKYVNDKNIRTKRRELIFQLVKNRARSRVLAHPEGQVSSSKKDKELISLWEAQIKKYPKAKYILANAASQLFMHDKKLAEQCLKKCQALDPNNPEWSKRLKK